jgi:hypothetical protein
MFGACPALLQSDFREDLERKAPSSFDAKESSSYLPCGIRPFLLLSHSNQA